MTDTDHDALASPFSGVVSDVLPCAQSGEYHQQNSPSNLPDELKLLYDTESSVISRQYSTSQHNTRAVPTASRLVLTREASTSDMGTTQPSQPQVMPLPRIPDTNSFRHMTTYGRPRSSADRAKPVPRAPLGSTAERTTQQMTSPKGDSLLTDLAAKLNKAYQTIEKLQASRHQLELEVELKDRLISDLESQLEASQPSNNIVPIESAAGQSHDSDVALTYSESHSRWSNPFQGTVPSSIYIDPQHAFHFAILIHNMGLLRPENPMEHVVIARPLELYADGFIFDNGPRRKYTDPRSLAFMTDIYDGFCPWELQRHYPRGLSFECKDQRWKPISESDKAHPDIMITQSGHIFSMQDQLAQYRKPPERRKVGKITLCISESTGRRKILSIEGTDTMLSLGIKLSFQPATRLWVHGHGYWRKGLTFENWTRYSAGSFRCYQVE